MAVEATSAGAILFRDTRAGASIFYSRAARATGSFRRAVSKEAKSYNRRLSAR